MPSIEAPTPTTCGWRRWPRRRRPEVGTELRLVTGVDDHSGFCVAAGLVRRASSKAVCEVLAAALARWGSPMRSSTDIGKCFTGRYGPRPVEVLFDKIA
jgi:hypothetical protein